MTIYDFVVTNKERNPKNDAVYIKLIVEKVAILDDDVTLDKWLSDNGVDNQQIGSVIEQLEALPYAAKHAYAIGRDGRILIEQV